MPAQSTEKTLLRAALTTYLWELAGSRAAPGARPEKAVAPPPGQALVSEASAWRLAGMFGGTHRELVPEWFALAAQGRRVLPAHWLPTALNALSQEERSRFAAVLGPQALWLAQMNPGWSVRASDVEPSEERWGHGTLKERTAELRALRKQDPDRARAWLEQAWSTEPPEARAELARVLLTGLTARDEGFLERMLDDRRKEVRVAAVECLARLPQSAHARRNEQRLEQLISAEPAARSKRSRKLTLRISTPEELDKTALRDGIEAKRAGASPAKLPMGERAYWLWQMVAWVPPRCWLQRFGCDVPTFLDAVSATDYGEELLGAFTAAAERSPDIDWIRALCQRWLASSSDVHSGLRGTALAALIGALGPGQQEPVLNEVLSAVGAGYLELLHAVLEAPDISWSARNTALAVERVRTEAALPSFLPQTVLASWVVRADVPEASVALADLRARLPDNSSLRRLIELMMQTIDFRAAMRKELLT
jgi:hypothetical protein